MGTHHMSAVDSAWLRMDSPGNLLVVNAIFWTEEPVDFDVLRTVIEERMIDRFPRFRQHPGSSWIRLGRSDWVDDEDFDVERHYRDVTLDAPGDEAALQAYVSSRTGIPLDPTRPAVGDPLHLRLRRGISRVLPYPPRDRRRHRADARDAVAHR